MGFGGATRTCLSKYATFSGRAPRSEFWFFLLFAAIGSFVGNLVDRATGVLITSTLINLALFLPSLAVSVRRLHDIEGTWWAPRTMFGFLWKRGTVGPNRYGPDPLAEM